MITEINLRKELVYLIEIFWIIERHFYMPTMLIKHNDTVRNKVLYEPIKQKSYLCNNTCVNQANCYKKAISIGERIYVD